MKKNTAFPVGWCFLLLLLVSANFGCAPKSRGLSDATADAYSGDFTKQNQQEQVDKRVRDYLAASDQSDPRGQDVLIQTAKTALGTPYVRGGTSTDGFDCSGFVQWTFNQVGVKLPRTAREQSRVGRAIRNVNDMEVGDIVAFHHPKRGYHTGIYVGEGKFIHSPRKRTTVRINALDDPYFSKTFLGARRIGVSSPEDIAAAEKMLAEYRDQESRRAKSTAGKASKGKQKAVASRESKQGKNVSKSDSRSASTKANATKTRQDNAKQGKQAATPTKAQSKSQSKDKKAVSRDSKNSSKGQAAQASGQKATSQKATSQKASETSTARKGKPTAAKKSSAPKNTDKGKK